MKTYRVRFDRDETGTYAVTVPEVAGCVTQASTVPEGLSRARDALALLLGDEAAGVAELVAVIAGVSEPTAA